MNSIAARSFQCPALRGIKRASIAFVMLFAITALLIYVARSRAASGDIDPAFNSGGAGANASVAAVLVQPDGKIIIGGDFTSYNGDAAASDSIMRLNADGTRDTTFNAAGTGANDTVLTIALQQDGKIILGGQFTSYNGDSTVGDFVMRLNADGTRDAGFNAGGAGANGSVQTVAVQPDGKIIIGGAFTSYNADAAASDRIMRLNSDGSRDITFNAGGAGADGLVVVVNAQPDGKTLVGGNFTSYNGDAAASDRVMRLNADGTRDATFNVGGGGADNQVRAITVQVDGRILIGGVFTAYNGDTAANDMVMRLNADGTRDPTFNAGGPGANFAVWSIVLQTEGKIIVGGNFSQYNGVFSGSFMMRLNADGTRDTTFNSGGIGPSNMVAAVALQQDGKIIAGGQFTGYNGNVSAPDFVIRLLPGPGTIALSANQYKVTEGVNATITLKRTGGTDNQVVAKVTLTDVTTTAADYRFTPGARDTSFNTGGTGANFVVRAVAVQTDGRIVIGGAFTSYNGDTAASDMVMRLNSDGSRDASFNAGGAGADSTVRAVALQSDGKILIGGDFTSYNGDAAAPDRIMRLNPDGSRDTTFNAAGSGVDAPSFGVSAVEVQPDGKIIIGGQFTIYNGEAAASDNVMRLQANGTRDATFNAGGTGAAGNVFDVAQQADGKIVIGGLFASYNGDASAPDRVIRLMANGTRDAAFNAGGAGADSDVNSVAVQADGKIVIGGSFASYNGDALAPDRALRLNADGTRDPDFNVGGAGVSHAVDVVALQPDGKILLGGAFATYNGSGPSGITRLNNDGSRDTSFNVGGTGASEVRAIALQPDGKIVVVGNFTVYNAVSAAPDRVLKVDGDLFVTWPAGDATDKIIQLPTGNDAIAEGSETLTVGLSLMSGGATLGSPNSATLTIQDPNSAPTITAAGPLTRQQGSAASNSQIATVNDAESGAAGVTVTVTSANPSNGVTVSNIANSNGVVTANLVAACSAGNASFTLTATDGGGLTATATLNVTVTANSAPTFSYSSSPQSVALNGSLNVTPTTATDNGSIAGFTVVSVSPALATAPTVNSSGVVSITNAQPSGVYIFTIRATDNCGTSADGVFPLIVGTIFGFTASNYNTAEGSGFAAISVTRAGDTSTAVSVDYASADDSGSATVPCSTASGIALSRCDFITAIGTLKFAAGETTRSFVVLISQDSYVEGPETVTLGLSNPDGGAAIVAPASTATLTIADDVTEPPGNMIDDVRNFVRQHYHDFLGREPDAGGWDFWANQISSCGNDGQCNEVRRIDVSASFFLSIEFQQSGYLVERFYKVAYGDAIGVSNFPSNHQLPVPMVRYHEFLADTQRIGRGVVVLQPGWEQLLESNKQAYALEFVQTNRFVTALPTTMTPAQFIDRLNQNAGNVLSSNERTAAINLFGGAGNTSNVTARAQAVRQVAEDTDLYNAEYNRAFVLAEYFGYLRRNPNDAPESTLDYTGYDFWLSKLNQFNGNYINAEMVRAFLSSIEYRGRFGH